MNDMQIKRFSNPSLSPQQADGVLRSASRQESLIAKSDDVAEPQGIKPNLAIKKNAAILAIILIALVILIAIGTKMTGSIIKNSSQQIRLQTTEGEIVIELYDNMPITTGNFVKLVNEGFYDGTIFHRVIGNFMIQGGDPQGTGMGGPGYKIKDEFTKTDSDKNNRGTIAMANAGPNTGGSQFFINLVNNNFLDGKHPAFGKVVKGMDVIDAIAKVETDANDKPIKP